MPGVCLKSMRQPAVAVRDRDRPVPGVGELAGVALERQRRAHARGRARLLLQERHGPLVALPHDLLPGAAQS